MSITKKAVTCPGCLKKVLVETVDGITLKDQKCVHCWQQLA